MHPAIWYVVLVCHQYDVCKNKYVGSGYGGLSESALQTTESTSGVAVTIVSKPPTPNNGARFTFFSLNIHMMD